MDCLSPMPSDLASGDPPDALLFGRIVSRAATDTSRPLTEALGLERGVLERMLWRHLPSFAGLLATLPQDAGPGADQQEEPDLRDLLRDYGVAGCEEMWWLAAVIARRVQQPNHLWQDMGLANRDELSALLRRYFPALVARNSGDMKWKKFLYRELCKRDGMLLCKSPTCEACADRPICFGGEEGSALSGLFL